HLALLTSQCSAPHLHLHSFPTRRSSDLCSTSRPANRSLIPPAPSTTSTTPPPTPPRCPPTGSGPPSNTPPARRPPPARTRRRRRSEEHTSELQSQSNLVCRLLLEKKNKN